MEPLSGFVGTELPPWLRLGSHRSCGRMSVQATALASLNSQVRLAVTAGGTSLRKNDTSWWVRCHTDSGTFDVEGSSVTVVEGADRVLHLNFGVPEAAGPGIAALHVQGASGALSNQAAVLLTDSTEVVADMAIIQRAGLKSKAATQGNLLQVLVNISSLLYTGSNPQENMDPAPMVSIILMAASHGCNELMGMTLEAVMERIPFLEILDVCKAKFGMTLLSAAVLSGSKDTVAELLAMGLMEDSTLRADEPAGPMALTALHWAALSGNSEVVDLVLTLCPQARENWDVVCNIHGLTPAQLQRDTAAARPTVFAGPPVVPDVSDHTQNGSDPASEESNALMQVVEVLKVYLTSGVATFNAFLILFPTDNSPWQLPVLSCLLILGLHQGMSALYRWWVDGWVSELQAEASATDPGLTITKRLTLVHDVYGGAPNKQMHDFCITLPRTRLWDVLAVSLSLLLFIALFYKGGDWLPDGTASACSLFLVPWSVSLCRVYRTSQGRFTSGCRLKFNAGYQLCLSAALALSLMPLVDLGTLSTSGGHPSGAARDQHLTFGLDISLLARQLCVAALLAVPSLLFPLPLSWAPMQCVCGVAWMNALPALHHRMYPGAPVACAWSFVFYWLLPSLYVAGAFLCLGISINAKDIRSYLQRNSHSHGD